MPCRRRKQCAAWAPPAWTSFAASLRRGFWKVSYDVCSCSSLLQTMLACMRCAARAQCAHMRLSPSRSRTRPMRCRPRGGGKPEEKKFVQNTNFGYSRKVCRHTSNGACDGVETSQTVCSNIMMLGSQARRLFSRVTYALGEFDIGGARRWVDHSATHCVQAVLSNYRA